ncbi:MAG: 23S rRNA (guanosine(2251)-2'-O)-methyltransferase RlmB [Gammaproteobacteria bacterium]
MAKRPFNIWGTHAVSSLLKHNPHLALEIWISDQRQADPLNEIAVLCDAAGVSVTYLSNKAMDKLCNDANHQGVIAKRRSPASSDLQGVATKVLAENPTPIFVALDQVQDPQNLGACLRLADAAGASGLLIAESGQAPLSGVVAKVASGAMDTVPIIQINNFGNGLRVLAKLGVWIVGTDDSASQSYADVDMTAPVCLVLGSEGDGLRHRTREICDHLVTIPIVGEVGSLNVSNAAAVCLFEARRQRCVKQGS